MGNIGWSEARRSAELYIQSIAEYDQEIFDEIIGISEGSGQDLLDIIALNARSEILLNSDGCTSMAFVPKATENRETLLAQNWDWNPEINKGVILLEIGQDPRPTILMRGAPLMLNPQAQILMYSFLKKAGSAIPIIL